MIRIVVAEDHHLVRQGICKLLEDAGDFKIVGEAENGKNALQLTKSLQPDVLVLDISMPEQNGLETLNLINNSDTRTKVVVLSMHGDQGVVKRALQMGALGYVLKQAVASELIAAVRAAHSGGMYLSAGVSQVLADTLSDQGFQNKLDRLSPREQEVVKLIVDGLSTRQIADKLHTSVKTVEKQRRDAMRKLDVDNMASLVRVSLELGLVISLKNSSNGV